MKFNPKVSVVIPTYNNSSFLADALSSIVKQSYKHFEIIVIDDGSTDGTFDRYHIENNDYQILSIPHSGAGYARNQGILRSTGEYLAFLDADDIWPEDKLHRQIESMLTRHIDLSFTYIDAFLDDEISHLKLKENNLMPGICASTMLVKKNVFLDIGLFDEKYKIGEFIEWFIRAKKKITTFDVYSEIIVKRRLHKNNTSKRSNNRHHDYLKILNNHISDQ